MFLYRRVSGIKRLLLSAMRIWAVVKDSVHAILRRPANTTVGLFKLGADGSDHCPNVVGNVLPSGKPYTTDDSGNLNNYGQHTTKSGISGILSEIGREQVKLVEKIRCTLVDRLLSAAAFSPRE